MSLIFFSDFGVCFGDLERYDDFVDLKHAYVSVTIGWW